MGVGEGRPTPSSGRNVESRAEMVGSRKALQEAVVRSKEAEDGVPSGKRVATHLSSFRQRPIGEPFEVDWIAEDYLFTANPPSKSARFLHLWRTMKFMIGDLPVLFPYDR